MTAPVATSATPTASAIHGTPLREAVDRTNRRFEELFNAGDPSAAARAVYTREARVMPPGASLVQGIDAIAQFWAAAAAQLDVRRVALRTLDLQPLGDGAFEIGAATLTTSNQQSLDVKYVVVWRQEEGRWCWDVDIWNGNA